MLRTSAACGLCRSGARRFPRRRADNVYTVAQLSRSRRSAENAVAAKEKALADGQQAAFRSLLKRLIPVTAYPRAKRLASVKAADLIEGVRVRAERNSSTEYIASFDFSFQAKGVRDLLRREGIPFTDDQAPCRDPGSCVALGCRRSRRGKKPPGPMSGRASTWRTR